MSDYISLLPDELVVKILVVLLEKSKYNERTPYSTRRNRMTDYRNFASTCRRINNMAWDITHLEKWKDHRGFILGNRDFPIQNAREHYHEYNHGQFWSKFISFRHIKFNKIGMDIQTELPFIETNYFTSIYQYLHKNPADYSKFDAISDLELGLDLISINWLDQLLCLLKNVTYLQVFASKCTRPLVSNHNFTPDRPFKLMKGANHEGDAIYIYLRQFPAEIVAFGFGWIMSDIMSEFFAKGYVYEHQESVKIFEWSTGEDFSRVYKYQSKGDTFKEPEHVPLTMSIIPDHTP